MIFGSAAAGFELRIAQRPGLAISGDSAHIAIMSDDSAELHVKVRHRNRPPKPYKWEIYRGNDPICIKRAMHGYRTQQAAANAGEKALRRFLESEALKQEQGIMADKHSKPPETPNDNAKSIDRWDDEGGAPSGGRSVRKRPRGASAKHSSSRGRLPTSSSRVKGRMSTAI